MLDILAHLLTIPLFHTLFLLILGLVLILKNKNTVGVYTMLSATLWLFACSQFVTAHVMMGSLEYPIAEGKRENTPAVGTKMLVVMACNYYDEATFPSENKWPLCSLRRLMRAAAIYESNKLQIVVSGGNFGEWPFPYSSFAKHFLIQQGVEPKDITEIPIGFDTESEVKGIVTTLDLNNKSVLLVTSASHMKRVRGYFELCKTNVIPAPTDYLTKPDLAIKLNMPSSKSMSIIKRALHEHLGVMEFRIKDYLGLYKEYC